MEPSDLILLVVGGAVMANLLTLAFVWAVIEVRKEEAKAKADRDPTYPLLPLAVLSGVPAIAALAFWVASG